LDRKPRRERTASNSEAQTASTSDSHGVRARKDPTRIFVESYRSGAPAQTIDHWTGRAIFRGLDRTADWYMACSTRLAARHLGNNLSAPGFAHRFLSECRLQGNATESVDAEDCKSGGCAGRRHQVPFPPAAGAVDRLLRGWILRDTSFQGPGSWWAAAQQYRKGIPVRVGELQE
jgi:hypothetical protein